MDRRQVGGRFCQKTSVVKYVSIRTSAACKYTGIEGSKICPTYILQTQGRSTSSCVNRHQAALAYLVKIEGTKTYSLFRRQRKYGNFLYPIRSHLQQNICWGL